jgi:hypothetical protein
MPTYKAAISKLTKYLDVMCIFIIRSLKFFYSDYCQPVRWRRERGTYVIKI